MVYNREFARCTVCDKGFSGPESFQDHLKSKKHKRKAGSTSEMGGDASAPQGESQLQCNVCDISVSGPVPYAQHLQGSKHKAQVNKQDLAKNLNLPISGSQSEAANNSTLYPSLVEVTPQGTNNATPVEVLKCELCQIVFSGPESAKEHLESKGHKRKMETSEWKRVLGQNNPPPTAPAYGNDRNPKEDEPTNIVATTLAVIAPTVSEPAPPEKPQELIHKHKKPMGCFRIFSCNSSKKSSKKKNGKEARE